MPLLQIHTNQQLTADLQTTFLKQASKTVAEALGKSEQYVMIRLNQGQPMLFAGSNAPLAFLELKSLGLPEENTTQLSATLCELIQSQLTIPSDRIYIEFSNAQRHMWGWDRRTF